MSLFVSSHPAASSVNLPPLNATMKLQPFGLWMFIPPNAETSFAILQVRQLFGHSARQTPVRLIHKNTMAKSTSKNSTSNPPFAKLAYTRDEAAQALGVNPITISRLTERGTLRPSRATRRPLYSLEELNRFLRDTVSPQQSAKHQLA